MLRSIPILCVALLAGCAYDSFTPNYDAHFGDAVRAAALAQTLHPAAGTQPPIFGLDGPAAAEAITRYQHSFKSPPPVVNVINVGGSVGAGGGGNGTGGSGGGQ